MAKAQQAVFSSEDLQTLIRLKPEIVTELSDAVDIEIERLGNFKTALTGVSSGTPTSARKTSVKRKSKSKRVPRGKHGEMAIKLLSGCGATSKAKGVPSSKLKGSDKHDFGSALNATLDTLAKKGIVDYENVSDNDKPLYHFWLSMPVDKALKLNADSAKAGRKPKKK